MSEQRIRLTQYASGGGCACKIPPGELEAVLGGLMGSGRVHNPTAELLVGLDHGDDAAVFAAVLAVVELTITDHGSR